MPDLAVPLMDGPVMRGRLQAAYDEALRRLRVDVAGLASRLGDA